MDDATASTNDTGPLLSVDDLTGVDYLMVLDRLHTALRPKSYLEIGTFTGDSLRLAKCASLAVDPDFQLGAKDFLLEKPLCALYQMTADDFFQSIDPTRILGRTIDFAFLDGMHRCEFLLRDFANTESFCRRNSIIALHDCLPVEHHIANRNWVEERIVPHRAGWWSGDVWRTALLLRRKRPDLRITTIAAPPTGLVLITNLDPGSNFITHNYSSLVEEMMSMNLVEMGVDRLHAEMQVEPQEALDSLEKITARYWL